MNGLLFDKDDLHSFRKIKTDIEEMLGFRAAAVGQQRGDHRKMQINSPRTPPKSSRENTQREPRDELTPIKISVHGGNSTNQKPMVFGKPRSPMKCPLTKPKPRRTSAHLTLPQPPSPIPIIRSASQTPSKPLRDRSPTPSFALPQAQPQPQPPMPPAKPPSPTKWQRLASPARTSQSFKNPLYLLDKKLERLKERVEGLRQSPEINKKSKEYYGVIGQMKLNSPVYRAFQENRENRRRFEDRRRRGEL